MEGEERQEEYPSAILLLDIFKDEYQKEKDRATGFENRAGIFISGIIAIITLYLTVLPVENIKKCFSSDVKQYKVFFCILGLLLLLIAVYFVIRSFIKFVNVLDAQDYQRVEFDNLVSKNNNQCSENDMAYELNKQYHEILCFNVQVNKKKADHFSEGVTCTVKAFIILLIAIVILMFGV